MPERDINAAHVTFPIVGTINGTLQFIGTGFFIDAYGGFVTAKHVLEEKGIDHGTEYIIVQYIGPERIIQRKVKFIYYHPTADICLGKPYELEVNGKVLENPIWEMGTSLPSINDDVITVAYPNSKIVDVEKNIYKFRIDQFKGKIVDIHNRCPTCRLTTQCYQTNINMKSGSSGGPVFNSENQVVGINSVSHNVNEGEDPISFITPLEYVDEIVIDSDGKKMTFGELKKNQLG